ncbi:MAG: hypothetical protein M3O46_15260, partial [Myxococcota bacterium]|nr:hypothetical protein [Myxococcota bacterium]
LPGNSHVTCVNNVCTVCAQVPSGTPSYLVDPNSGSDVGGTGDNTTAGCAFRTIKRALQVIGTPLTATTITVLGPATVNAGETFPIVLPANVSVTTTGGSVQVDVPAGVAGVNLSQIGTAIGGGTGAPLTIGGPHGGVNDATFGIVVGTGTGVTTGNSPQVSEVRLTNFLNDGIIVQGTGIARIGAGVTSTLNGRAGLHVTDTGRAIVDVASGATPTHFDANSTHGVLVDSGGSIRITGTVTDATGGVSTVTTSRNFFAGVSIQQTAAAPPANTITGLASFASPNGNGIRIVAGSNVRVRDSISLNNQLSGVFVTTGGTTSNDISNIDLGTGVDAGGTFGGNTFQEPFSSPARNTAAGVCLSVMPNAGSLHAAGNVFGAVNCATTAGTLTLDLGGCDNSMCTGGVCDLGIVTTTGNDIDVSMCGP